MSSRQRTIWCKRNSHLSTNRDQFSFILSIEQIIVILHYRKLCPATFFCYKLHIVKLVTIHCRCTNCSYFSSFHQIMQSLHCFLNRCIIIKSMNNIQIQIICAQPLQSAFDFPHDCFCDKRPSLKYTFEAITT